MFCSSIPNPGSLLLDWVITKTLSIDSCKNFLCQIISPLRNVPGPPPKVMTPCIAQGILSLYLTLTSSYIIPLSTSDSPCLLYFMILPWCDISWFLDIYTTLFISLYWTFIDESTKFLFHYDAYICDKYGWYQVFTL